MDLKQINAARGLIFDLDGTLANSMPVHLKAWQKTGEKFGFQYSQEDLDTYAGMSGHEIVRILNKKRNLELDPDAVVNVKEQNFIANLHLVNPIEPVVDIFKQFSGIKPIAVGTGSFRHIAEQILENIGLGAQVKHLVSADDVRNHKPEPDTFLRCAELMNIPANECLVFEDAELGFQAAKNAGMNYIDVRPVYIA